MTNPSEALDVIERALNLHEHLTINKQALAHLATLRHQVADADARIIQLEGALKFAEHAARALYSNEAKASFVKLYTPVYGVDGHLSQALIIQALQQALSAPRPEPSADASGMAQAVIDVAGAVIDAAGALVDWPWFENVAPEEVALSTAVKVYRAGGAS